MQIFYDRIIPAMHCVDSLAVNVHLMDVTVNQVSDGVIKWRGREDENVCQLTICLYMPHIFINFEVPLVAHVQS